MHHAADIGKGIVQGYMGSGIGGGLPFAFHLLAGGQGHHHHILGSHVVILNTGGFDDYQPLLPVHTGNIAPGEGDQTVLRQFQVSLTNDFLQFF